MTPKEMLDRLVSVKARRLDDDEFLDDVYAELKRLQAVEVEYKFFLETLRLQLENTGRKKS